MTCVSRCGARHDLTVRRGDSTAIMVRFRTLSEAGVSRPLDLSDSDLILTINWPGGGLVRESSKGGLVVDALAGTMTWLPDPAHTLQIPDGRIATYRIIREVTGGERRTLLTGFIIGVGFTTEGGDLSNV